MSEEKRFVWKVVHTTATYLRGELQKLSDEGYTQIQILVRAQAFTLVTGRKEE